MLSAGVLGETAPALAGRRRALGLKFESRVCGTITHAKGAKGGKEDWEIEIGPTMSRMLGTWPPLTYPRLSWALAPRWGGRSAIAGGDSKGSRG